MTSLYMGMGALGMMALGFILWPLMGTKRDAVEVTLQGTQAERQQTNVNLYREHVKELEANRARGAIDEAQYQVLLTELQRALLQDSEPDSVVSDTAVHRGKGTLWVLAILVPVLSVAWYWRHGAAQDWQIADIAEAKYRSDVAALQAGSRPNTQLAQDLLARLESRLVTHPDNQQNWYLLARTALELKDYIKAIHAYQQILHLAPESDGIMAEQAQAMFLGNGNRMAPDVSALVSKALKLNRDNTIALGLAGIAAFEQKQYDLAIQSWRHALSLTGTQSTGAQALLSGIARAQSLLHEAGAGDVTSSDASEKEGSDASLSLTVNVSLGDLAKTTLGGNPDITVFIYARAWQGAKMPLAIQKVRLGELPLTVSLDESMAMAPGMGLSSASDLQVLARVSLGGGAIAQPGDWIGRSGKLNRADLPSSVALVISELLP